MRLNFFDVFRFFTEIELTGEQRKYELICVTALCVILFIAVAAGLVINGKRKSVKGEKDDDSQKKR